MAGSTPSWGAGSRVAGHAALEDIKTFSVSAELRRVRQPDHRLAYQFEPEYEAGRPAPDVLIADGNFRLIVGEVPEDTEPDEAGVVDPEEALAEIRFNISALYALRLPTSETGGEFTEEELNAFANSSAQFALYPYARALVADLVAKLGLPTLTLPTLSFDVAQVRDDQPSIEAGEAAR